MDFQTDLVYACPIVPDAEPLSSVKERRDLLLRFEEDSRSLRPNVPSAEQSNCESEAEIRVNLACETYKGAHT